MRLSRLSLLSVLVALAIGVGLGVFAARLLRSSVQTETVDVPAGEFWYGCNARVDRECARDERPGGSRPLRRFRIDRTEVTVAQYADCVEAGACSSDGLTLPRWRDGERPELSWACNWDRPGHERHPVNCVDWHQASAFCEWKGGHLPSEREWEKAARGQEGHKYPWGNRGFEAVAVAVANIRDEAYHREKPEQRGWTVGYDDGHFATAPVGSFPEGASPYGALDMIGNVYEWTSDPHESRGRVVRGGSWRTRSRESRASNRHHYAPELRRVYVGFRCAHPAR